MSNRTGAVIKLFADLIKYRLSAAVTFSAVTGYFMGNADVNTSLLILIAGIFLLSSGSAAMNQYTERKTDLMMERTKNRPVPSGRIPAVSALRTAIILISSGALLLSLNGIEPVMLGLLNVIIYNIIYTHLKKVTVFSIIPGGIVGAIPPMIGYSSAGGDLSDPAIIAFALFMFFWQVPHFWMLIIKYGNEYRDAGLATISAYFNESQIKKLVFAWVLFTSVIALVLLTVTNLNYKPFIILVPVISTGFIILFYLQLFTRQINGQIKRAFVLINSFSIFIMLLLILSSVISH